LVRSDQPWGIFSVMLSIPRDLVVVEPRLGNVPAQSPGTNSAIGEGEGGGLAVLELLASDPVPGTAPQPAIAVTSSTAATKNQPGRRIFTFLNEAWEASVTSARAYAKQML